SNLVFQFFQETLCCPSMLEEQVFQAGFVAALAKDFARSENLRHAACDGPNLVLLYKCIEPNGEMGFGRESAANTDGETDLFPAIANALRSRERNVVDLRVAAPGAAAGHRHFELTREIVKVAIAAEILVNCECERRGIDDFTSIDACNGASGNISYNVT